MAVLAQLDQKLLFHLASDSDQKWMAREEKGKEIKIGISVISSCGSPGYYQL